jgi:hypothetical protein
MVRKVPMAAHRRVRRMACFRSVLRLNPASVVHVQGVLSILGIVVNNLRSGGLFDEVAHFQPHELVDASACRVRSSRPRALARICVRPRACETGRSGFNRRLQLLLAQFLECLQNLTIVTVDALVAHDLLFINSLKCCISSPRGVHSVKYRHAASFRPTPSSDSVVTENQERVKNAEHSLHMNN